MEPNEQSTTQETAVDTTQPQDATSTNQADAKKTSIPSVGHNNQAFYAKGHVNNRVNFPGGTVKTEVDVEVDKVPKAEKKGGCRIC